MAMKLVPWSRAGLGFPAAICLAGVPQGAAAHPSGAALNALNDFPFGRSFDIQDPTHGARCMGIIEWGLTSMSHPGQAARITNASVMDIAPDDNRAVAWIRYDRISYTEVCEFPPFCSWEVADIEHFTPPPPRGSTGGTLPPAGNVTPNGVEAGVSWSGDPGDLPVVYDKVQVKVCTEQWRFEPNRVIACSAWS